MIRIRDTLAGDTIWFYYPESTSDLKEAKGFLRDHIGHWMGFDTESTGVNPYRVGWQLRTAQWGNATEAYVIPAECSRFIGWAMAQPIKLVGHNGPHDIRSVDVHLGYETEVECAAETYIPSHHADSRSREEGGVGHKLKELAMAHVDYRAGKWETALKAEFKKIQIRIPGEFYKSGPRKGTPKYRKAKISEGWSLIDKRNRKYIAYAGSDPILTYRLREFFRPVVQDFRKLYKFDQEVAMACDVLQRRAILLDVGYTKRLSKAYARRAAKLRRSILADFDCENVNSTQQIAEVLLSLDVRLRAKTPTGKWKVNGEILRALLGDPYIADKTKVFIRRVLVTKQIEKRRESYTDAMLRERDENDRVHPSINSIAARTTRMSVSGPPLQQLPTKDREEEVMWEDEEE